MKEGSMSAIFNLLVSVVFFPTGCVVWIKGSFFELDPPFFFLDWFRSQL